MCCLACLEILKNILGDDIHVTYSRIAQVVVPQIHAKEQVLLFYYRIRGIFLLVYLQVPVDALPVD